MKRTHCWSQCLACDHSSNLLASLSENGSMLFISVSDHCLSHIRSFAVQGWMSSVYTGRLVPEKWDQSVPWRCFGSCVWGSTLQLVVFLVWLLCGFAVSTKIMKCDLSTTSRNSQQSNWLWDHTVWQTPAPIVFLAERMDFANFVYSFVAYV